MRTITARNVNHALPIGLALLRDQGIRISPRGIETLEMRGPVATTYLNPLERVLFSADRDANPFFHFFEALWILAGRSDVEFLAMFNKNIANYSDDGIAFHAPYGWRLRHEWQIDQIEEVIELLDNDPDTRRAVLAIWNPDLDLNVQSKDIPCNDLITLKIREGELHMVVMCRSNDVIWGAYGANVVQFSTLLEYIAARLNVPVGTYTQISDSFHVYTDLPYWKSWLEKHPAGVYESYDDLYTTCHLRPYPLFAEPEAFDRDLKNFFDNSTEVFYSAAFINVVMPLYDAWNFYKNKDFKAARYYLSTCKAEDWRAAATQWILKREGTHNANA